MQPDHLGGRTVELVVQEGGDPLQHHRAVLLGEPTQFLGVGTVQLGAIQLGSGILRLAGRHDASWGSIP